MPTWMTCKHSAGSDHPQCCFECYFEAMRQYLPSWPDEVWDTHLRVVAEKSIVPKSDEDVRFLVLALGGEVGEAQNLVKKEWRGDFTMDEVRIELARELADARVYLELAFRALGLSSDQCVADHAIPKIRRRWPAGEG